MANRVHAFRHRGLRVRYQHLPGPLTAIALVVRAGARFDRRHPGIAHMAEHMLFQGTASLDQLTLNRRAAELGGEHNADTGYEDISLTIEVFNEDLPAALALLAEQFYHTRVDPNRFRKERRVVLDEVRSRADDPGDYLHTQGWCRFFGGALAHPVCGTWRSLNELTAADVSVFLRRCFVHANSVLAVVGGVALEQARSAVRRHFAHGNERPAPPAPPVVAGSAGQVRLRRFGGSQASVSMMLTVTPSAREIVAMGVALDLVGADPDSRLFQEVRERLGLGYDVSATLDWGPDWAVAIVSASAARGQRDRLLRTVADTCQRAAAEGFALDELQRARKKIRYRYASLAESRLNQALALAEGVLSGFPTPAEAERIAAQVTRAEVEAAWRRAMTGRALTVVLAG
ncbi:MAG TPA: pitrilysin family protein [Candidatus Kryptonia bacterium]|nr:pitrilysin family protein [Candidatus Kryptonia bacterium]